MASPIKPSDVQEAIPNLLLPACSEVKKGLATIPELRARFVGYLLGADGRVSNRFAGDLCEALAAADCSGFSGETTTSTTTDGGGGGGGGGDTLVVRVTNCASGIFSGPYYLQAWAGHPNQWISPVSVPVINDLMVLSYDAGFAEWTLAKYYGGVLGVRAAADGSNPRGGYVPYSEFVSGCGNTPTITIS
jgi:hypothetical protein